ncbi:hypothetical protein ABK040_005678 [Willaertia magna]
MEEEDNTSIHPHHRVLVVNERKNLISESDLHKQKVSILKAIEEQKNVSPLRIVFVVVFYFIISISTVYLNKYIMDLGPYTFHFPLTMTWIQLVIALLCIFITYSLNRKIHFLNFLPNFEYNLETSLQILPLSIIYVGMLSLTNLCLDYSDIHLFHTSRSISICFTAIFTFLLLGENISLKIILSCLFVFLGYILAGMEEIHLSKISEYGLAFGLLSSCFTALYSVFIKKLLVKFNGNFWILLCYNTITAVLIQFPICILTGEFQRAISVNYLFEREFIFLLIVTAVLGFLVNIAHYILISLTSPLTNSIAHASKSVFESLLSVALHETELKQSSIISSILIIGGAFYYSQLKHEEEKNYQRDASEENFIV